MDAAQQTPNSCAEEVVEGPSRRCIVTRDILPKELLIRFVIGPSGDVVPDVQGKLPGRGLWVKADRQTLNSAVAKDRFAKAARRPVEVPPDLVDRTTALLRQRCLDAIGLAKRAGQVVCGYEKVRDALRDEDVGVLIAAADGAMDGRAKLRATAGDLPMVTLFARAELSAALGRENVVHAAVAPGRLAERLVAESARLTGMVENEAR